MEGGGTVAKDTSEVLPGEGAGEVEEEGGMTVCGHARETAEDNGEDGAAHECLQDDPEGAEDGLLVGGDKVAMDEEIDEVSVAEKFPEFEIPPWAVGPNDDLVLGGAYGKS